MYLLHTDHLAGIDPKSVIAAVTQDNVLQQLIFMVLNENSLVVKQTCGILSLLSKQDAKLAATIVKIGSQCFISLMLSNNPQKQIAVVNLISTALLSNESTMRHVLNSELVSLLLRLSNDPVQPQDLRTAALKCLGNLGFCKEGKLQLRKNIRVIQTLTNLANVKSNLRDAAVKSAAIRALAILGEVNEVERAVGRCPDNLGIKILSLDGGGMKGLATVRMLKEIERRANKPIHRLFDLIVGTSTGALLAVALGLRNFSLSECEKIYKELGQKVFSRPAPNTQERERSWMDIMTKSLQSTTEHVRVVVVGHKHDTSKKVFKDWFIWHNFFDLIKFHGLFLFSDVYEQLLKEYCSFPKTDGNHLETIICTSSMDVPKIALVSTRVNESPASPFVFRNYEFPVQKRDEEESEVTMYDGSSRHEVWQAVRASSGK